MSNLMIKIPFSEEEKLAELEGVILADRMRHCWKLWNKGHPFVEIVDYKCTDDNFEIVICTEEQVSKREKWWDGKIEELAPFILARFIQELSILHRDDVPGGHYQCHLQHHPSLRIILTPAAPIYRNKLVSIHSKFSATAEDAGAKLTDIRRLILLAQKAMYPFGQASGLRLSGHNPQDLLSQAAEWISKEFGAIPIPVDKKTYDENNVKNCFLASGISDSNRIWECCLFESEFTHKKLGTGNSHVGRIRIFTDQSSYEVRNISPKFNCILVSHENLTGETLALRRMWTDCINGWNQNYFDRALFNIEATLQAEKMQLLRECYPVTLIPITEVKVSPEFVALRLQIDEPHPIFGDVTRIDGASFIDHALEEGIFEIILNDNPDPLYTKGKRFEIISTKENDPNILILKPMEIAVDKVQEKGWIRLNNPGTRILQLRKTQFIRNSLKTKVIQRILIQRIDDLSERQPIWKSRHPNWRFEGGNLQLIQGPPGTGKTWTATRLVEDIIRERPQARILLCAKEHLALDHLASSVSDALQSDEFGGIPVVRMMSSTRREKLPEDSPLNPDFIGNMTVQNTLTAARTFSKKKSYKTHLLEIENSMVTENVNASWPSAFAENEAKIVAVSVTDQIMVDYLDNLAAFDYIIVEEAGKSYPSELLAPISLGRTSILIGDQMQLPPFEIREIRDNIGKFLALRNFQGNRKDWGNRQLSDLIRDSKFAYFDHSNDEIVQMIEPLLEPFKLFYQNYPSVMLNEERRMFELLSDIVGRVFYDGPFKWMKENSYDVDNLPKIFKENGRIVVYDMPHCSKSESFRESRARGRSLCNVKEAEYTAMLADQIRLEGGEVVVLSPYQGQVDLITEMLETDVPVFTVDGYQGKEADYILLSLVRNNEKTATRRWGFVNDPNRLNVALSRAREGMIVLTSLEHLRGSEFQEGNEHLLWAIEEFVKHGTLIQAENQGGDNNG
jgi:hypothetical protein